MNPLTVSQLFSQARPLNGQHIVVVGRLRVGIEQQELWALDDFAPDPAVLFAPAVWISTYKGRLLPWQDDGSVVRISGKLLVAPNPVWPGLGHMGGYWLELKMGKRDRVTVVNGMG
ncbi:hypothetical protein [Parachitinimonas caeni]|uniref:Uncharacterized protein n=1 Tax=Parachitinimonas caeni TaxID=3031301 RepID=A0ABT7DVV2_9NEIS|nr:hypothetical protein [Parachitinimonas caeni]MDK2124187.1 hypothetical protein [Parachitinimonas caeni]